MSRADRIVYIRPASGGIQRYSQLIERLYAQAEVPLNVITVDERRAAAGWRGLMLGIRLALTSRGCMVHAEIGFHSATTVWALLVWQWLKRGHYVLTIHEAEPVLESLFPMRWWGQRRRPISSLINRLRRILDGWWRQRLVGRLIQKADHIITLQPDTTVFGRVGIYLPHPVYLSEAPAYQQPPQRAVGFLGYWGDAKGIEVLIQAAGRLTAAGVQSRWIIAGSTGDPHDEYSRSLRRLASQSGATIEFPGSIPETSMLEYLQSLSVLVIPYRHNLAGLASGMAVWATNAGVPVIASATPALKAQLDGVAGWVPPDDPVALGEAIAQHLEAPAKLTKLAAQAQSRLLAERTDQAVSSALLKLVTKGQGTQ